MSKKLRKQQPPKANPQNMQSRQKGRVQPDNKRMALVVGAIAIGVIMAVVSWMILPDSVSTQLKSLDTGAPNVPKIVAVALPLGITIFSAVQSLQIPDSIKICLVGYAANILFWISNM